MQVDSSKRRIESHPLAVGGEVICAWQIRRNHNLGGRHLVLPAIRATPRRGHRATLVSIVLEGDNRHPLTDHETLAGQPGILLQRLPQIPDLFVIAAGLRGELVDEIV